MLERSGSGATQTAVSAVSVLDVCSTLMYDTSDHSIQLRRGAGEAMHAIGMQRVAVAAGKRLLSVMGPARHSTTCAESGLMNMA